MDLFFYFKTKKNGKYFYAALIGYKAIVFGYHLAT